MTFFYPDISNVGNAGLNLDSLSKVVCAKASEGTTFRDPSFADFKAQAIQKHIFFMAYHWTWCVNPQAEAKNAFRAVGPDVPLMWDVENLNRVQTVDEILDLSRRYRALGGHDKLLYLPHWYWADHMGQADLSPLRDQGLLLVSSNYTTYNDNGVGWNAYGNMFPYVWQFSSHTPYGNQTAVDFNACRDTVQNFIAAVAPTTVIVVPPQPTGDDMTTHWNTVKRGSTGPAVKVAQGILIAHGLTVGSRTGLPDGDFGPTTEASTRSLQSTFGISVDGQFGPHTLSVGLYGHDYA